MVVLPDETKASGFLALLVYLALSETPGGSSFDLFSVLAEPETCSLRRCPEPLCSLPLVGVAGVSLRPRFFSPQHLPDADMCVGLSVLREVDGETDGLSGEKSCIGSYVGGRLFLCLLMMLS